MGFFHEHMQNSYLQGVLQDPLPQVLEHTILSKG